MYNGILIFFIISYTFSIITVYNVLGKVYVYISECPIRKNISSDSLVTASETMCGYSTGWNQDRTLYDECYIERVGRYIHVIPAEGVRQVGMCEVVVHGLPLVDVGPDVYNESYSEPADENTDGVPDMCGTYKDNHVMSDIQFVLNKLSS